MTSLGPAYGPGATCARAVVVSSLHRVVSSLHAAGVSEYAPALPPTKCRQAGGQTSVASAATATGTGASTSPPPGVSSSRLSR